jgi:hypothetical protein
MDHDGYYIPKFSSDDEAKAKSLLEDFKTAEKDNPYWDLESAEIESIPYTMANPTESKVYIGVQGGVVQEAYSNNPDIKVEVWDWDNIFCKETNKDVEKLEMQWQNIYLTCHRVL